MATATRGDLGNYPIRVSIISPEETVFEGDADRIIVPAWDGGVGILKNHAPMMVLLGAGELRVGKDDDEESFEITGGFLQVIDNVVTVLSEWDGESGTRGGADRNRERER